jgi:hypothetical protein
METISYLVMLSALPRHYLIHLRINKLILLSLSNKLPPLLKLTKRKALLPLLLLNLMATCQRNRLKHTISICLSTNCSLQLLTPLRINQSLKTMAMMTKLKKERTVASKQEVKCLILSVHLNNLTQSSSSTAQP